jgi:S-adenosylmethionine synthetase
VVRNLVVEELRQIPVNEHKIEIVERKGLGHPDTICDLIANQISINLCEEYLKKAGIILHHNVDKSLLAAGEVVNRFGGGIVKKPMLLVLGDRATFTAGDLEFPVNEIAITTAKNWFKENLRFVDPENHVRYQSEIKCGSAALQDIFKRRENKDEVLGANDTSAAVGYAPFTPTEKIVYDVEKFLNSEDFKKKFPESGEDIKVMGLRTNSELNLTVAMAFVDRFIDSEDTYFKRKMEILEELKNFVSYNYSDAFNKITCYINTLDQRGRGIDGIYLTVTGTCADGADCGQVGRGNRGNGVISLNRPASEEAAAGKNPVSHVGKIYNILSFRIANEIYQQVPGLREVYVWLLSQIGRPINDPKVAAAQVVLQHGNDLESVRKEVREVLDLELGNINKFCMDLAKGKIPVC